MDKCIAKLTVYFENPFWIGIYERDWNERYTICKITFGAEPTDSEVYEFVLKNWSQLKFSPSIQNQAFCDRKMSPKRMQRSIRKELQQCIGTKAQQALKLQQEQRKLDRKLFSKERQEQESKRKFALRQEKRKAKHKGH